MKQKICIDDRSLIAWKQGCRRREDAVCCAPVSGALVGGAAWK